MPSFSLARFLLSCWYLACCCLLAGQSFAQDSVTFKTEDGQTKTRKGRITNWLGKEITLNERGRIRTINAEQVINFKTQWSDDLRQAREQVANNDFRNAIATYNRAIENEQRDWIKSLMLAELVQVFDTLEAPSQSIRKFLQLYQLDSQTRFFFLIPLSWSASGAKSPPESDTAKWMEAKNNLLRLLGASWQLSGSQRGKAVTVLENLASDSDPRIAQLAATQLWRTRVFSAKQPDVERWQRQIESIDSKLRAGPLVVLADAQQRNGLAKQAQISLLKVPILFPEKKSLAAFALFRCGSIREDNKNEASSNKPNENAFSIWQELIRDYPASQYAELARGKL